MRRILVTGIGGSPSVNFTRSLRQSDDPYHIVGTDADKYYLQRGEADTRYLAPLASDPSYIDFINHVVEREGIDLVHAQNDVEVGVLSDNRDSVRATMLLPRKETIRTLQDKFASFQVWQDAGIKVPQTVLLSRETDLKALLGELGGSMWIRAITGAGGRGSLPAHDVETARNWLDFQEPNGSYDGNFTASELLEPATVTWMSIWKDGELVVAQTRKRLYWELSKISPSGVTGATGTGVTYSDPEVDEIAERAVRAIDSEPSGLFGVDMAYDRHGVPNPTEINVGRFFTTHQFFTAAGLNMPDIFVKLALGDELPAIPNKLNPLPDGLYWIRGIDFEPVLVTEAEIEGPVGELAALMARVGT